MLVVQNTEVPNENASPHAATEKHNDSNIAADLPIIQVASSLPIHGTAVPDSVRKIIIDQQINSEEGDDVPEIASTQALARSQQTLFDSMPLEEVFDATIAIDKKE